MGAGHWDVLCGKIADFYFPDQRLVVEIDGGYHYFKKGQRAKDRGRQRVIEKSGRRVIRFDNKDVINFPEHTIAAILKALGPAFE